MTDEFDLMVDNTFEQQFRKPRKDLRDVLKYKKDEYLGDEDFNSAYITPADITVPDLFPDEYNVKSKKEIENNVRPNTRAYFSPIENEITFREDASNSDRIHENIHKQIYKKYKAPNRMLEHDTLLAIENRYINTDGKNNKLNILKTDLYEKQINSDITKLTNIESYNTIKKNDFQVTPFIKNSIKRQVKSNIENITNPEGYDTFYYNNTIDENMARFGAKWPEEIINPTTKTGKRLNRIWFE